MKNNVDLEGQTSARLVIPQVTADTVGKYNCTVSNSIGTVMSDTSYVALADSPPKFTKQTQSLEVCGRIPLHQAMSFRQLQMPHVCPQS